MNKIVMNKSIFLRKSPWIAIWAFTALAGAGAIVNTQWNYFGALLLLPLLIYFFMKKTFLFFFGLYAFLLPLDTVLTSHNIGAAAAITKYLAILIIAVLCVTGSVEEKFKRPDTTVIWWILLSLYSLVTLIWAVGQQPKLYMIINTIAIPVFYVVVSSYKINEKDYALLKWCIIGGGVALSLLILNGYNSLMQAGDEVARASVQIGEDLMTGQNFMAFSLLLPASMTFQQVLQQRKLIRRALYALILGVILLGILLTGSRGGMLGVGVAFIVYFLLSRKKLDFLAFAVPLMILVISLAPSLFFDRWGSAVETGGAGRTYIWHTGVLALGKYWLTGAGLYNFPAAYNEFSNYVPGFNRPGRASHNLYLNMFVELGIVGFTLMIIGFARHYQAIDKVVRSKKYDSDSIMLKASFWSLLVSSFFLDAFWYKQLWILWILIMVRKNALAR